ncbi:hypothetical protein ACS81_20605 [Vibrio parahaemolyticus]|nr:hypothetical protein ACS81_20605 [Vibrio parahaemolyticus]KWU29760.1 hypothetical protein AVL51_22620 [Vibrio parahaemolyticus]OEA82311.1 hypothetical protein BBM70_20420 [Vibrio parahaemolyticus]OEB31712.1 hypothetical protein BBM78_13240 [Vibrio parahaemolyticus]
MSAPVSRPPCVSLALSFVHWLNYSLCSEVKSGGLPLLGFSLPFFRPFLKKGLNPLIDTGSAYLEKLGDLCA